MSRTFESFMEVAVLHEEMEALFLEHQKALICMEAEKAKSTFEAYCALLALHIEHEDHVLMPVFRRIGEIKRWPAVLYEGEHRKLEAWLDRCRQALAILGEPTPEKAALIVDALDMGGGLKRLQEHHDQREREAFFPILDQVTEPEERRELLERVFTEWDALKEKLGLLKS